ncbi:MAG: hypothetical protein D5R98_03805 [Desulfonatronovibrio sp. MSAO_Bac4]|nr:MAG: hypothetical protein D5R98_03805 [Desulfonatronovibrio sp. MSAO_Bac4]
MQKNFGQSLNVTGNLKTFIDRDLFFNQSLARIFLSVRCMCGLWIKEIQGHDDKYSMIMPLCLSSNAGLPYRLFKQAVKEVF